MIRDWIERAAARNGTGVYLEDARGTATLTYAGLRRAVLAMERCLLDAGLPPGARVAVRLSDPVEYATALVALLGAGRVAVPLDPRAPTADVARVLAVALPAAAVTDVSFGLPSDLPWLRPELSRDGEPDAGASGGTPAPGRSARSAGIFLCTSGTTGTPKGILLREAQLAHVADTVAGWHRLAEADRGYCSLPLFHVNAEVVGLLATLRAGARLALDRKFSRAGFWDMIREREITWINAVPAIISILAMEPPASAPARVRFVRSASAPLPLAALERFETALGIPVIETYGMTEAASMIAANPLDGLRKPGSAGLPAGAEVRVAAPGGPAPAGYVGRVQIRGAGVITRYAEGGRPGAIDPTGWLDTGDLGYIDDDGYLFLVGRSDDVINRGGEKIYPREIEEILLAQPGVHSAAVVGAGDDVLGECPVAYVVPQAGWPEEKVEAALREACAADLPKHKQPREFFLVVELPLGSTGKIARHRLKDLVAARR
ncbi:MAG TPA: AMP-binding protein [Trebonia sp.]|nr:AMP-binding protein [Trebonia sp.]